MKILLAVDIGNTSVTMGIFKGRRLLKRHSFATKDPHCTSLIRKVVLRNRIEDAVVCSVVPAKTREISVALKRLLSRKPLIIGKDIPVPIKNLYRKQKEVGQDRLVNAYAGVRLFGAPLVAVDFGTAITFDAVSKKGEYLGGMILPGLGISLDALSTRTALLPAIRLKRPKEFLGKDTGSSMTSGIIYGFAALTDDLTQRIRKKIGLNALVIGTGGNIRMIRPYCRKIDKLDQDLTLKGLSLLYSEAKGKR